jgi:flavodoxin
MRTLVAYYSRSGNTKFVAEKIAECLNAETCEVVDKKNRKGKWVYLTGGYAALREKLTEIEVAKNIDDYDFIIAGSPVWGGKITPAIRTFLVKNDFSGKQVAYFVTVGGDKPKKALRNMNDLISPIIPVGELGITNAIKNLEEITKQITDWCKKF